MIHDLFGAKKLRESNKHAVCVHFKEKVYNSDEGDVDKSQRFLRVMNHDVVLKVGSPLVQQKLNIISSH